VNKTVSSVIDDINEWNSPNGTIYYVTAIFTDESVGSAGKKNYDAALEVQGLLREVIGVELDFTLEPKGQTKTGREKFNIKGFGTPGGVATYTAPGVQGTGAPTQTNASRSRSPEPFGRSPEHFAAEAALRAAVEAAAVDGITGILKYAEAFYDWMLEKTSDASSAYPSTDSPSVTPAGASEDSGGGVESKGKEPAPPPHIHDWQPHPNLRNKLKCECGEMRNKASV
jgi:hypothetical protein